MIDLSLDRAKYKRYGHAARHLQTCEYLARRMYDMVGNVWEWRASSVVAGLIKGGSYLCALNYCANFRPAAFQAQELDLGTSHIGFRTIAGDQPLGQNQASDAVVDPVE